MSFITITKENAQENQPLIDQYKALQIAHGNREIPLKLNGKLEQGEVLFLSLNAPETVVAGALLRKDGKNKEGRNLKDGDHLPRSLQGNVGYVYGLVASTDKTADLMSGLALQQKLAGDFHHREGEFADIDVLTADVVRQNMLLSYEASQALGLKTVVRKSLQTGSSANNQATFVAIARDHDLNLIPVRRDRDVVSEKEMREMAHKALVEFKEQFTLPAEKADKEERKARAIARRAGLSSDGSSTTREI